MERTDHRDELERYVRSSGLKWTRQRKIILDAFLRSREHLTIDEIHRRLARTHPDIGSVTVYRTLRLFVDAGIATEHHFQDGVTRYEIQQPHHDHLICLSCGRIVEFERDDIELLQEEVARSHGFSLVSHRHELYGQCEACRAAPPKAAVQERRRRASASPRQGRR